MSYASIAARGGNTPAVLVKANSTTSGQQQHKSDKPRAEPQPEPSKNDGVRRSPSPSHVPKTELEEENTYVLTLRTNIEHHKRMTDLRRHYFPKELNKLEAHLTLFHALPGSKLESSILPTIQQVCQQTSQFDIHANKPFRLKRGIAILIAKNEGGQQAQKIHGALRKPWLGEGFLSDQDRGGVKMHYTIMNKVDNDKVVDEAFQEVSQDFAGDHGIVEGLALYRYDRGWWRFAQKFDFRHQCDDVKS